MDTLEAEEFAMSHNFAHVITSAKTGENVEACFDLALERIAQKYNETYVAYKPSEKQVSI